MILDDQLSFGRATAGAMTSGDIGDDIYDRGAAAGSLDDNDIIAGAGMWLILKMTTAFTGGDRTNMRVKFVSATATDLTTGQKIHGELDVPLADLTANSFHRLYIPKANAPSERYFGVQYDFNGGTTDPTGGGVFETYLVESAQENPVS